MTAANALASLDERFADVRGVRIRYFVGGSGPPLILVHGLGGAAATWIDLAPALARHRTLLIPDLPGHGGSAALPAAPSLSAFADRIVEIAAREDLPPVAIAGHSTGGVVALRAAVRHPEYVTALVLVAAAGITSARRRSAYALRIIGLLEPARRIAPYRRVIARSPLLKTLVFGHVAVADPPALRPGAVEAVLAGPALHVDIRSAARALVTDDPRPDLHRVRCPTLVLWGARDHQLPIGDAFEYARRLRAPIRVISDCGHLLIVERPEACVDAIESFLDSAGT